MFRHGIPKSNIFLASLAALSSVGAGTVALRNAKKRERNENGPLGLTQTGEGRGRPHLSQPSLDMMRGSAAAWSWSAGGSLITSVKEADGMVVSKQEVDGTKAVDPSLEKAGAVIEGSGERKKEPNEHTEAEEGEGEEEESKCAFCVFNERGPCAEAFTSWSKCVTDARANDGDFVAICSKPTEVFSSCMKENPEYYAPMGFGPEEDGEEEATASE